MFTPASDQVLNILKRGKFDSSALIGVLPGFDYPSAVGFASVFLDESLVLEIVFSVDMVSFWDKVKGVFLKV